MTTEKENRLLRATLSYIQARGEAPTSWTLQDTHVRLAFYKDSKVIIFINDYDKLELIRT